MGSAGHDLESIKQDVICGFENAACSYFRISGGWELHRAPEYYSTVKVAEQLAAPPGRYVTLEQSVVDTLNWASGGSKDQRAPELPDQGRFDIAVWGAGETGIIGIIEIKEVEYIRFSSIERDIVRVCDAMSGTAIQWSMVAWYATVWQGTRRSGKAGKSGAAQLNTRTANIEAKAREYAASWEMTCERLCGAERDLHDEYGGGMGRPELLVFQSR